MSPNKLFNTDITVSGSVTTVSGIFTDSLTVSGVPVALGAPIEALVGKQTFRGARVSLVSNQTITTATNTQVLFDTTEFDTDGFVVGGDESEFIIPAGVSKVRLRAMCFWVNITSGDVRQLSIRTGGFPGTNAGTTDQRREADATGAQVFTYIQDVTPGQDFNVLVRHVRGTDLELSGASVVNWFEIEVIEDEQDWLVDEFTAASGTFTQSLTISGVPVQIADVETFELRSKNFSGAVAHRASAASGTITLQDADPGSTRVDWGTITVDTDNFVNLGTADTDSIFTIPAGLGIKKVQVEANFTYTLLSPTTDSLFTAEIQKNGVSTEARSFFRNNEVDQAFNYNPAFHMTTAIEEVVDGDTFQFVVRSETAGVDAAVADNNRTWFSIKVLERDAPFTMGEFTAASGTFTQSLTVSGVPVATGTGGGGGASTLQEAYDNGDGTISITDGKPFELTSSGGLVAVTGTFTEGLTVGTGSTVIADGSITTATGTFDSVTVSGVPVLIGPVDTLLSKNFSGAVVSKEGGGDQAISGSTLSEWPVEILDTDGFFDSGTNTRFTIPSGKGIKKIRLTVCVQILADTTPGIATYASIFISKNGLDMVPSISWRHPHVLVAGLNVVNPSVTYPIEVEDGDYFELFVSSNAPGSPTIWSIRSYWAIEVVERDAPFTMGEFTAASGTFTQSLTISGVPVNIGASGSALTVEEVDGNPSVSNVDTIRFTNGSVTDDTGGQVTIDVGGGSGITSINAQTGPSVTITGVGGIQTTTDSNVVTIDFPSSSVAGFSGAILKIDTPQAITNAAGVSVQWDSVVSDEGGWADLGADNTIFTVPEGQGVTHVRLLGQASWEISTSAKRKITAFLHNGSNPAGVSSRSVQLSSDPLVQGNPSFQATTAVFAVNPGDTLEMLVFHDHGSDLDLEDATNDSSTWFSVERVNPIAVSGTEFVSISGAFTESLTVSGVPVATGTVGGGGSALTIRTPDSAPSVSNVSEIVVASGSLYDDGAGQVTIGPLPHLFAMKQLSGSTFAISTGFNIVVAWDLVVEDTDGREGTSGLVAGDDGFTIPEHLTNSWWVAKAQIGWEAISDTNARTLTIFGPPNHRPRHSFTNDNNGNAAFQSVVSAPFMAPAGTHIRVVLTHNTGTDKFIQADGPGGSAVSWFSLERVGVSGTI